MKRLSLSIILTMLMSMVGVKASAYNFIVNGIYYNITSNSNALKAVSVTYQHSYQARDDRVPSGYVGDDAGDDDDGWGYTRYCVSDYNGVISIPSTVTYNGITYQVTSVGDNAFENCYDVTSVNIPNSVSQINESAFRNCKASAITLPNSITTIGEEAFYRCTNLSSMIIPSSVTSIGSEAFSGCSGLTSITIPNSVTSIERSTFYQCSSLTSIIMSNSVKSIDYYAFSYCSSLTSITIPNSVTYIGDSAFFGCSGLTSITIPSGVTSIGAGAFYNCSGLTNVNIPNSVTSLGTLAFFGCKNLTSVTVNTKTPLAISSNTITNRSNATLYVPIGSKEAYLTADYWNEFNEIIEIPDPSIIVFEDTNVKEICLENWDLDNDGELSKEEAATVTEIGTLFKDNSSITSFDELKYFTGLTSIHYNAFNNCSNLKSIVIPSGVSSIAFSAFYGCPTSVQVDSENMNYLSKDGGVYQIATINGTTYKDLVFVDGSCSTFTIESDIKYLSFSAFDYATKLEKLIIDESDEQMSLSGNKRFSNCPLKELILCRNIYYNDGLDNLIGTGVFQNMTTLEKITLGGKVTSLGDRTFYGCTNLRTVKSEANISYVGFFAFEGTKWIQDAATRGVAYLGNYAAGYDGTTPNVSFKSNTSGIARGFFSGKKGLGTINIPSSITHIPSLMFYFSEVSEVIIPTSVSTISYNAFGYCKIGKLTIEESNNTLITYHSISDPFASFQYSTIDMVSIGRPMQCKCTSNGFDDYGTQNAHPFGCADIGKAIITKPMDISGLFDGCGIRKVELPEGLTAIGTNAFRRTDNNYYHNSDYQLTEVIIPNTVTTIGSKAFIGHEIESIIIPSSVTTIEAQAFEWNYLKNLILPNSIKSIGEYAFYGNKIESLTLPNSLTTIGSGAFGYNYNLNSVIVDIKEPLNIDESTFKNSYNATLYVPHGSKSAYETAQGWQLFKEIVEIGDNGITTDISESVLVPQKVECHNGVLVMDGLPQGTQITVYTLDGIVLGRETESNGRAVVKTNLPAGSLTIVKINDKTVKVVVK